MFVVDFIVTTKKQKNFMNVKQISIALPSYNTLNYTMMAYRSLRKYYPDNEIIIMDDGSTDGSWEWTEAQTTQDKNLRLYHKLANDIEVQVPKIVYEELLKYEI